MPKTVTILWPLDQLKDVISFDAIEVNHPVPIGAFRLDFPINVHVTDFCKELYYVTGREIEKDTAHEDFLKRTACSQACCPSAKGGVS